MCSWALTSPYFRCLISPAKPRYQFVWRAHWVKVFPGFLTPKLIKRELKPLKNRWLFQFRLTMGFNESNAPLGPIYPIYLGAAYMSKRWSSKNKFFGGFDYSYSDQIYAYIRNNGFVPSGQERWNSYKTAVFAGNEFLLGRVGVVLQLGYYTHQMFDIQEKIMKSLAAICILFKENMGPSKSFFYALF